VLPVEIDAADMLVALQMTRFFGVWMKKIGSREQQLAGTLPAATRLRVNAR